MAITDLLLWANDIEDNRLPAVEADQLRLDTLISAKVQEFGDKLDQHNARINNNFQGYNAARGQADYALTRIYETGLQAQTYTDAQIQLLRDELASLIGGIGAYVNGGGLTDSLNAQIATQTTGLTALVNAATQEVLAVRDQISLDLADIRSANEDILNTVLPDQSQTIQTINQDLTTVKTDVDLVLAGFDYDTLIEGLDAVRSRVADQIAPLGVSVPQDPSSAWTTESRSTVLSPKAPLPPSWLKTNDPVLGSCAELTAGAAVVIGQAAPVEFAPDRVYRVRARVRTVGNGTSGGAKISLGVTTFAGSAVAENAAPKVAATALAASSSTSTVFTCVFSTNLAKLQAQGYSIGSGVNDQAVQLVTSGSANKAFFYLMQNEGGTTNGQVRVGLLEVKDITDAIDAAKIVETKLDTKFGEAMASVNSLSYVVTEQGTAIAANRTALETSINNVSANLSTNYYTKSSTDSAIATQINSYNSTLTSPTGALGTLSANLTTNYYTKTATDAAITAASTTLSSSIAAKGKVIFSSTAPAAAEQLSQNLWIDTANGANTPKMWNGSAWVAVTDKVATNAAASAAAVSADLSTNYYTKTGTDSAISSASTTLSAATAAKGKVIFQSTAPAAADQLTQNLWIDTANGANTPKRWSGSAWVAVTDKVASDAAASVATVSSNLSTNYYTKTATDSAISASATNLSASISTAQSTADGKGKVIYSTAQPPVADQLTQNLWIDLTGGANTPKRWNGTAWAVVSDKAATDALSAANTVSANLSANYYTKVATDAAISASATTLNSSISNVQAAVSNAQSTADGKGKVFYSTSAPAVSEQLSQNLWIDLTGGANTPKRWNGTAWQAVTDKVATDAAAAAATAQTGVTNLSSNLTNNYYTKTATDAAIASASTTLSSQITTAQQTADGKGKVLFQSTTPAAADQLAQNLWIDTTGSANTPKRWNGSAWVAVTDKVASDAAASVTTINANLTANYYTKTATDSAISASTTALKTSMESSTGSIGILSNTLTNDYYTKTGTDAQISAASTNLTSVINSEIVFANGDPDFREGLTMWGQSGNGADPMAISVASTRVTTRASTDSLAGGMDIVAQGYAALFSRQFFLIDPRRTYKLTARVKREAYVSGNARLYLGFRCLTADGVTSVGTNSGNKYAMANGLLVAAFPVGDFVEFTATITGEGTAVNQFNAGTQAIRLLAYLNYSETTAGNVMAMSRFALEDVTNAKAEADAVTANLTNNYYTKTATDSAIAAADLSLKAAIESPTGSSLGATLANTYYTKTATDSAIASQITTYNASVAGGLTATVTSQGSAISTLQNNAAASLLFRTKAGTAGAELELVSASSPSGSASSARISAQNLILDGTVTFTQQSYGGGGNLLRNTDFGSGTLHWDVTGTGTVATQTSLSLRAAGLNYAGRQYPTLMLYQNGTATDGTESLYTNFWKDNATQTWVGPGVAPNQWYELSTQISTIRCLGELVAEFFDSALTLLSSTVVASQNNVPGSSTNPDSWARIGGKVQAPATAAFMRFVVRKNGTSSGTESYVFVHKPFVGLTHSAATALSPYSVGGSTVIDGASIKTGTVTAHMLNVKSATSGARIEILTDRIVVYRADGTVAVKIGNLS